MYDLATQPHITVKLELTIRKPIVANMLFQQALNDDRIKLLGLLLFERFQEGGDLLPASTWLIHDRDDLFASIGADIINDHVGQRTLFKLL